MILVDTNVLVALADERDRLHARARGDLKRVGKKELGVTSAVLTETLFLLSEGYLRARLAFLVEQLPIRLLEPDAPWWPDVFGWLEHYAEHEPDFVDAQLAVLSGRDRAHKVWTYDREFHDIWRRPDGSKIPLVGSRS
jgi:predicted nucleic acid-binding protein